MKNIAAVFLILISTFSYAATDKTGATISWGYKGNIGPSWWGKLDPGFSLCNTGKRQSPINIPKQTQTINSPEIFTYKPTPFFIMDDGLTNLTINNTQTIFNDGHTIQVNFAANSAETFIYNNVKYHLIQFHFHTPSETAMRSQRTPLEVHFVHQADGGKVAVVAVLMESGEANSELQKIVSHLPSDHNVAHEIKGETINPSAFLPSSKAYYAFEGSLTTPPCTEGLQWIVMANTMSASPAQILKLRNVIGNNARPTQKLFGRTISYSGD